MEGDDLLGQQGGASTDDPPESVTLPGGEPAEGVE